MHLLAIILSWRGFVTPSRGRVDPVSSHVIVSVWGLLTRWGSRVPSGQRTSVTDLLSPDNPMWLHYTAPPSPGPDTGQSIIQRQGASQHCIVSSWLSRMSAIILLSTKERMHMHKTFWTHIMRSVKYPESSWLILKVCGIFVQIGETWHFAVDLLCSSSWPSQTYDIGDQTSDLSPLTLPSLLVKKQNRGKGWTITIKLLWQSFKKCKFLFTVG